MRRGLLAPPLAQERASQGVMGVVVYRRELEHLPELPLGSREVGDPEIRDPERLPDRRLLWLEPPRLLERHGRLRRHALAEASPPELIQVVGLAHRLIVP